MAEGIVMRVHRVRAEVVVAACDAELIGQTLRVGPKGSPVVVSPQFYGERVVSEAELIWSLRRATIANLLGERAVELARREGMIGPGGTGLLGGVPHAQIVGVPD